MWAQSQWLTGGGTGGSVPGGQCEWSTSQQNVMKFDTTGKSSLLNNSKAHIKGCTNCIEWK